MRLPNLHTAPMRHVIKINRGLLGQKESRNTFSWHPSGNTWFVGFF